jgi:hypothetical protein
VLLLLILTVTVYIAKSLIVIVVHYDYCGIWNNSQVLGNEARSSREAEKQPVVRTPNSSMVVVKQPVVRTVKSQSKSPLVSPHHEVVFNIPNSAKSKSIRESDSKGVEVAGILQRIIIIFLLIILYYLHVINLI